MIEEIWKDVSGYNGKYEESFSVEDLCPELAEKFEIIKYFIKKGINHTKYKYSNFK